MATMTHDEATGARVFQIPIAGSLPGGAFMGPAELRIETAPPGDRPARVALRYFPGDFEFQAKLPRLVEEGNFGVYPPELSRAAREAQPIVVYEGDAAVLSAVPAGLADLPALEAFLGTRPAAVFDVRRYALAAIEFEAGDRN